MCHPAAQAAADEQLLAVRQRDSRRLENEALKVRKLLVADRAGGVRSPSCIGSSSATWASYVASVTQQGSLLRRQHAVDIEENDEASVDLAHAFDEIGADACAECRRRLDLIRGDIQHRIHRIDDDARRPGARRRSRSR